MFVSAAELASLVAAAFCAGVVDAVGGGGGLITLPALFAVGLGPHAALATNKGQACFGAAASLFTFVRSGGVDRERIPLGLLSGFMGSLAGALLVSWVRPEPLKPLVLALLGLAGLLLVFRDRLARPSAQAKHSRLLLASVGLAIGAYDGFFGPGTGTLLIVACTHFFGDTATRASGNAKVINLASNAAALLVFQARATIVWEIALPMAFSSMVGAGIGARLALRHGDRIVRAVALIALVFVSLKVAFDWFASV